MKNTEKDPIKESKNKETTNPWQEARYKASLHNKIINLIKEPNTIKDKSQFKKDIIEWGKDNVFLFFDYLDKIIKSDKFTKEELRDITIKVINANLLYFYQKADHISKLEIFKQENLIDILKNNKDFFESNIKTIEEDPFLYLNFWGTMINTGVFTEEKIDRIKEFLGVEIIKYGKTNSHIFTGYIKKIRDLDILSDKQISDIQKSLSPNPEKI